MSQIEVDTRELRDKGLHMRNNVKILNDNLNKLFKRIEEVPSVSNEWVGDSSIKFVQFAKVDKTKYYKIKDDLDIYGKYLCDFSDSLEIFINQVRGMF